MRSDDHQHARFLIDEALIVEVPAADALWLSRHTETCAECAGYANSTAEVVRGLRSLSFETDPAMNGRVLDAVLARRLAATPSRRVGWAAAVLVALAATFVYRTIPQRELRASTEVSDEALQEAIDANLSRGIPAALAPLSLPTARETTGAGEAQ